MRLNIKMPKVWDKCVKEVKMKIKKGEMPKTYIDVKTGRRLKSNPYKICAFLLKKSNLKKLKGGKKKNVK